MSKRNIQPKRNQVNEGYRMIVDFYKTPLTKAITRLQEKGDSLEEISKAVFNGEISKQAIKQNYLKNKEDK